MNELLFTIIILLTLLTIFCLSKLYGKQGLIFALIVLDIISFLLSFKIIEVFRLNINLGIVPYIGTLSIIYIYLIKYGPKEIKKNEMICLYTNIMLALLLVIMNYMIPSITETVSINIQGTFEYNYKILIIFPTMMFLSQYIITKLYNFVSQIQSNIPICIILTYIITALVYIIIFYILCYIKVLSISDSLYIGLSTYIVGLIITIINIVFISYIVNSKKVLKWLISY